MFFRTFIKAVCILGLVFPVVRASSANNTVVQAPPPVPTKPIVSSNQENKPIDLPVVVGQDIKGITIPQYDATGRLSMRFSAEKACKIDEHQVDLDALVIEFFEKDGKDITITVPHGVFDLVSKTLSSTTNGGAVTIKREDFDVTGQSATFDTVKRFGTMQGRVHTEIRNGAPAEEL